MKEDFEERLEALERFYYSLILIFGDPKKKYPKFNRDLVPGYKEWKEKNGSTERK